VDIGAPFKVQSEPYTTAASAITPKRNIWLMVVALAVVAALVIIQLLRTKRT
jgi:hypothetical protein